MLPGRKNAAHLDHLEARIAFRGNTKAETRTKHTITSALPSVEIKPVAPDPLTLDELLQTQTRVELCRKHAELMGDPQSCFDRY